MKFRYIRGENGRGFGTFYFLNSSGNLLKPQRSYKKNNIKDRYNYIGSGTAFCSYEELFGRYEYLQEHKYVQEYPFL